MMFGVPLWLVKILGGAMLLAGIAFSIWLYGHHQYTAGVSHQVQLDKAAQLRAERESLKVTNDISLTYAAGQTKIEESFKPIIAKVNVYVTQKDISECTIHNGFVQLWNAANKMQLPDTSQPINDAASGVTIYDVATEHTREAEYTHRLEAQVRGLQDWIRKESLVYSSK